MSATDSATAHDLLARAARAQGLALPHCTVRTARRSAMRHGSRAVEIRFTGLDNDLRLRTDAGDWGTWSLWLGGERIGVYPAAGPALAEVVRRGRLGAARSLPA